MGGLPYNCCFFRGVYSLAVIIKITVLASNNPIIILKCRCCFSVDKKVLISCPIRAHVPTPIKQIINDMKQKINKYKNAGEFADTNKLTPDMETSHAFGFRPCVKTPSIKLGGFSYSLKWCYLLMVLKVKQLQFYKTYRVKKHHRYIVMNA